MTAPDGLRRVPLFADLADDDLEEIRRSVERVHLAPGTVLFQEGDVGETAYVITAGDVEVLKVDAGRNVRLAVRSAGDVIGEMALLQQEPRSATVRARAEAELLAIPQAALDRVVTSSPAAARAMFRTLSERMRETTDLLRHSERMAQLGTLTAGVAHELNNPAAAVSRAADQLGQELRGRWSSPGPDASPARRAAAELLGGSRPRPPHRSALEASDAEAELESWLRARGIATASRLAPELVEAGLDVSVLERLAATSPDDLEDVVGLVTSEARLQRLADDIARGARRLSDIVRALKGYAHLDRGDVQEVDVVAGLEDTLLLLGHRLRQVTVVREYEDVPTVPAHGGELNQVWTNLLDNACDAVASRPDPRIVVRVRRDDDTVVVEIEDNGPGIPDDVRDRVFDAFFTTKPPGQGTGLGLQLSYRIMAQHHGGDLRATSEPGRTTFRAELPVHGPARPETS